MPAPRNSKKPHTSRKSRAIERQKTALSTQKTEFKAVQQPAPQVTEHPVQTSHQEKQLKEATYPYLVPELKRIGILAASILVILIILSIVLT